MRAIEILTESPKKYLPMFGAIAAAVQELARHDLKPEITRTISNVEEELKREDRIVWYLRWYRLRLVMKFVSTSSEDQPEHAKLKQMFDRYAHDMGIDEQEFQRGIFNLDLETLKHFATFPAPKIQDVVWLKQSPSELIRQLEDLEQEWTESRNQLIQHSEYMRGNGPEVFIDFGNGWAWYNLNKSSCDLESKAMGHCGNSAGQHTETVLSLRKDMGNGEFRPSLTFIMDEDGELGEMKGRGNQKPASQYHDMIIALLLDPRITGIKGGGYLPENNFSLKDLPDDVRAKLVRTKPELKEIDDLWWEIRDIRRVKKKKVAERVIDAFVVKLDNDLRSHDWQYADIDMERDEIIIHRYADRDDYLKYLNGFNATLKSLLEDDLPRKISQSMKGIDYSTAERMCDALYDDRFDRLFDEILPYDFEFVLPVTSEWRNGKLCHILTIDDYMSKVHDELNGANDLYCLEDCLDYSLSWSDVEDRFEELDELDYLLLAETWWLDSYLRKAASNSTKPASAQRSPYITKLVQEVMRQYSGMSGSTYRDNHRQYKMDF